MAIDHTSRCVIQLNVLYYGFIEAMSYAQAIQQWSDSQKQMISDTLR